MAILVKYHIHPVANETQRACYDWVRVVVATAREGQARRKKRVLQEGEQVLKKGKKGRTGRVYMQEVVEGCSEKNNLQWKCSELKAQM